MSEVRTNDKQQDNEQVISNLKILRQLSVEQDRPQFVSAIDAALKALGDDEQKEDKGDGLRLSGTASEMLEELSARVRNTTLSASERTRHAHALVRLHGGGR